MGNLKKIISLNQAAQISGYTQDYLGYLLRNGEIKGVKKGRVWFTTEEAVKDYLFKRKIRQEKFAIGDFFSPSRTKKIIIFAIIVFLGCSFLASNLNKGKNNSGRQEIKSAIDSDGEAVIIKN
jgi:hypothetical protein